MEIERDMPECEKWNMKDVHETGEELKQAIDDLEAITQAENERQAKYAWNEAHAL